MRCVRHVFVCVLKHVSMTKWPNRAKYWLLGLSPSHSNGNALHASECPCSHVFARPSRACASVSQFVTGSDVVGQLEPSALERRFLLREIRRQHLHVLFQKRNLECTGEWKVYAHTERVA